MEAVRLTSGNEGLKMKKDEYKWRNPNGEREKNKWKWCNKN